MSSKFFYLYIAGGLLATGLLIYDIIHTYPKMIATNDAFFDAVPAILLFYLAYKTHREKVDKDLM